MGLLRRKKLDIRVPTGRDAVNFRKLLFLSVEDTQDLLANSEWERVRVFFFMQCCTKAALADCDFPMHFVWHKLDLRCLALMKTKMLRASCIARGLSKKGGKKKLVQRLMASLSEQKHAEFLRRQGEGEEYQRQLDMLGGVWSFGSGYSGQLGHGDMEPNDTPRLVKKLRGRGICQVYAGFDSDLAFAISRTGDVYVWGKRSAPTGLPPGSSFNALMKKTYPKEGDFDSSEDESDDEEGQDDEEEGGDEDFVDPVKVFALCGEGINHIAVGRVHCCAKTKDGDVFTWGQNDHCQLGKEPVHNLSEAKSKKARVRYGLDTHEPQLWERSIPETCVIKAVDVGTNRTFAVTDAGEVHAFGATFHTSDHSSLTRSLAKLNVVQILCGAVHAGLVTSNGQAFTWGSGDGGRLGHGDTTSYVNPKLVDALKDDIIFELSCGCWHTVAVVLIPPLLKGDWYDSLFENEYLHSSRGGKQISPSPGLVTDFLATHALIKKVCAGMYHNVALSVDDEVFTWGSNSNGCLGRPEELAGLEEGFCAVPARVKGMEEFVGRPCSIACGKEFTLIATKPYIGPSREELERRQEAHAEQAQSIKRQSKNVRKDQEQQLERIRRGKISVIVKFLNATYPKCSICTIGTICPGFQRDSINPAMCKHCMHERRKHDDLHKESDRRGAIPHLKYLEEVIDKLAVTIDFSEVPDIELETALEEALEEE